MRSLHALRLVEMTREGKRLVEMTGGRVVEMTEGGNAYSGSSTVTSTGPAISLSAYPVSPLA